MKINFWIVGVVYNTDTAMTTIAPVSQTRAQKSLGGLCSSSGYKLVGGWLVGWGIRTS